MAELTTYKRWRLRPGVNLEAVRDLVRDRIAPHYATLDPTVRLGLQQIDGTSDVLAIQRWPDRARRDAAMAGPAFEMWWQAYRPILTEWDRLVEFVAEWESPDLVGEVADDPGAATA